MRAGVESPKEKTPLAGGVRAQNLARNLNVENYTPRTTPPQLAAQETLEADAIRIDLERVAGRLHIRLRPATIPPGISAGTRVCIELGAANAALLGQALQRHAAALGVSHG